MSLHRKFSPGFSRAVNHLLRSLPGVRHATGTASGLNAATTMEKLDAALYNMSHGLCMFGPDNRLLLWNDRYVKMYKLAPDRLRVGSTLDEMLEARKAAGTAYRDLGQYGSKLRIGTGLRISDFTRFSTRPGLHLRIRSEGMLRWKCFRSSVPRRASAPRYDRPQRIASSAFDEAPGRFLACLPLRKRMSMSVPLTRTSSHRR
jgi:PAS domain-containing protein